MKRPKTWPRFKDINRIALIDFGPNDEQRTRYLEQKPLKTEITHEWRRFFRCDDIGPGDDDAQIYLWDQWAGENMRIKTERKRAEAAT